MFYAIQPEKNNLTCEIQIKLKHVHIDRKQVSQCRNAKNSFSFLASSNSISIYSLFSVELFWTNDGGLQKLFEFTGYFSEKHQVKLTEAIAWTKLEMASQPHM